MARSRSLGQFTRLRQEAREQAALFANPVAATRYLRYEFPDMDAGLIDREYNAALREQQGARILMNANRNLAGNPARLLGCDDPDAIVTARVTVQTREAGSGRSRRYSLMVDLHNRGKLSSIIDKAIADVIADAAAYGYDLESPTSGQKTGGVRYSIDEAECP